MSYEGRLLARARERLAEIRKRNGAELERRRTECLAQVPGLAAAEAEFRSVLGETIRLAAVPGDHSGRLAELDRLGQDLCAKKAEMLVASGHPADYLEEIVSCRRCGDTGYTPDGRICSCLDSLYRAERESYLSSLVRVGRESFGDFSLDYYQGEAREVMELTLENCRRFALEFGDDSPNLLFQGGTGLGKTFLSGCVAKAVAAQGFSVCYETAAAAFRAFEDEKFSRDQEAAERAARILDCSLLILDDLGTEMTTPFTQSALYNIVNTRLTAGLKTIISTNLTDEELGARYLPQITSRIFGEYETQVFMGRDIRAQKKERRYS